MRERAGRERERESKEEVRKDWKIFKIMPCLNAHHHHSTRGARIWVDSHLWLVFSCSHTAVSPSMQSRDASNLSACQQMPPFSQQEVVTLRKECLPHPMYRLSVATGGRAMYARVQPNSDSHALPGGLAHADHLTTDLGVDKLSLPVLTNGS